jgi:hypothetical protein
MSDFFEVEIDWLEPEKRDELNRALMNTAYAAEEWYNFRTEENLIALGDAVKLWNRLSDEALAELPADEEEDDDYEGEVVDLAEIADDSPGPENVLEFKRAVPDDDALN